MVVATGVTPSLQPRIGKGHQAKAGEAGRLFGTVTTADVAKQLKREAGIDIDKRKIEIDPPIRSLGPHEATIELHPEVTETLKVVVAAQ